MLQSAVLNKMLPKGFKLELNERTKHHVTINPLPKIDTFRPDELTQESPYNREIGTNGATLLGKRSNIEAFS